MSKWKNDIFFPEPDGFFKRKVFRKGVFGIFDPVKKNSISEVFKGKGRVLAIAPSCEEFVGVDNNGSPAFFSFPEEKFLRSIPVDLKEEGILLAQYNEDNSALVLGEDNPSVSGRYSPSLLNYLIKIKTNEVVKTWMPDSPYVSCPMGSYSLKELPTIQSTGYP